MLKTERINAAMVAALSTNGGRLDDKQIRQVFRKLGIVKAETIHRRLKGMEEDGILHIVEEGVVRA